MNVLVILSITLASLFFSQEAVEASSLSQLDRACLICHEHPDVESIKGRTALSGLCLHCHGVNGSGNRSLPRTLPTLLKIDRPHTNTHPSLSCLKCHPGTDRYPHDSQEAIPCRSCHDPHPAGIANDPHLQVECKACHLKGVAVRREPLSGRVIARSIRDRRQESLVHEMTIGKRRATCSRCHKARNGIGAAPLVLPAKSMLCLPCHSATFSASDPISIVSVLFLVFGSVLTVSIWFSGGFSPKKEPRVPVIIPWSTMVFRIGAALVKDVLLNRRLFAQSPMRWLIHAMIVFPFLFRGLWGLAGLFTSHIAPGWPVTWLLLDRNFSVTALLFDASGLMVVLGVILALVRGATKKTVIPGLPKTDLPALLLIGSVILIGFALEGIRMTMAPLPPGSAYAFVGYGLSRLLVAWSPLDSLYGMVWYAHAVLTGIFVAYLPFSRLRHMVIAPIVMVINSVGSHHQPNMEKERR